MRLKGGRNIAVRQATIWKFCPLRDSSPTTGTNVSTVSRDYAEKQFYSAKPRFIQVCPVLRRMAPSCELCSISPLCLISLNWLFPRWPGTLSACVQAVSIDLSDNFPKQCSMPSFFLNPHHISIVFIRHITGHSVYTLVVVSHWLSLVETWL